MSRELPGLKTVRLGRRLLYFDELASTNAYLKENAAVLPHGAAVIAQSQIKGRGRPGKSWSDPAGAGLALSLLLHGQNTSDISRLPLLAGLGVVFSLEAITGESFSLKWSNDVLYCGKKLCGILCESKIAAQGTSAVVGIGVNLAQTQPDFDHLGLVYATSLQLATGKIVPNLPLAGEICNQFEQILEDFEENGFNRLKETYKSRCITLGKQVRVITGKTEQTGLACDIADDGALICEIGGKLVPIYAGETSVRGLYGYA